MSATLRRAIPCWTGLVSVMVAACGGGTEPVPAIGAPGISIVSGGATSDTVATELPQALVVEVRRPDGTAVSGTLVLFEAARLPDPTRFSDAAVHVCPATEKRCRSVSANAEGVTDGNGRARVYVRLGYIAGPAFVRVEVPALGLRDSVQYTVLPGTPVVVRAARSVSSVAIGGTAVVEGVEIDLYGNTSRSTRTRPSVAPNAFLTVDAVAGTVSGVSLGVQWVYVRKENIIIDSTRISVVPPGRLVVWDLDTKSVRLVGMGTEDPRRVLASSIGSVRGTFPRFDASGAFVTMQTSTDVDNPNAESNTIVTVDTSGATRRDLNAAAGFRSVSVTRRLADGTLLVVGLRTDDAPAERVGVFRVASDGSVSLVDRITTFFTAVNTNTTITGGADFSRDGTRLAYLATEVQGGASLHVRVLATGADTVVAANARSPRWSPQGDRLAYLVPFGSTLDGTVVIINADGSNARSFADRRYQTGIAWSPDGQYVLIRRAEGQSGENALARGWLEVLRVQDGATVPLIFERGYRNLDAQFVQPDWR